MANLNREEYLASKREYADKYRERNRDILNEKQKEYYKSKGGAPWRRRRYRENTVRNLVYYARRRAKNGGFNCDLKPEDLIIPAECPVLGIPIIAGGPNRDNWPSIDRFDISLGYTKDNSRIISYRANRIKQDASADELIAIFRYISNG